MKTDTNFLMRVAFEECEGHYYFEAMTYSIKTPHQDECIVLCEYDPELKVYQEDPSCEVETLWEEEVEYDSYNDLFIVGL
jgi:hypothetical protein